MATLHKLNKEATTVFCQLLERLEQMRDDDHDCLRLKSPGYLPLSFERLYGGIQTPWGEGTLYSLMHWYIQEGDVMRDPDMVFVVVDNRRGAQDPIDLVSIYPQSYQADNMGLYQESLFIDKSALSKFSPALNVQHCDFANMWLINIQAQGFLQ
jgi:hypothetical protein